MNKKQKPVFRFTPKRLDILYSILCYFEVEAGSLDDDDFRDLVGYDYTNTKKVIDELKAFIEQKKK